MELESVTWVMELESVTWVMELESVTWVVELESVTWVMELESVTWVMELESVTWVMDKPQAKTFCRCLFNSVNDQCCVCGKDEDLVIKQDMMGKCGAQKIKYGQEKNYPLKRNSWSLRISQEFLVPRNSQEFPGPKKFSEILEISILEFLENSCSNTVPGSQETRNFLGFSQDFFSGNSQEILRNVL
ncbi:hypothetical protein MAR_030383, partial [Mya arenaria]